MFKYTKIVKHDKRFESNYSLRIVIFSNCFFTINAGSYFDKLSLNVCQNNLLKDEFCILCCTCTWSSRRQPTVIEDNCSYDLWSRLTFIYKISLFNWLFLIINQRLYTIPYVLKWRYGRRVVRAYIVSNDSHCSEGTHVNGWKLQLHYLLHNRPHRDILRYSTERVRVRRK